ncbi:MAG: protein kinase [Kofleriaceae bacterium]
MASSETLRAVLDAGAAGRRLDELGTARLILKVAEQVHAAQQKAGSGKSIGPVPPSAITIDASGTVTLGAAEKRAVSYAAPEQLDGGDGDRRSDVWTLGVVMWEALAGQPLFEGGDEAAIKAAVRQQTIDPPAAMNANIPSELSAICMRALSRNPSDRYQSAKVMAAEVEAVLDDAGYTGDDKIKDLITNLPASAAAVGLVAEPAKKDVPLKVPADMPASSTAPGVVIPRGDDAPRTSGPLPVIVPTRSASGTKPPSILDQKPTEPPSSMTSVSQGSLEDSGKVLSPTSFLKPATQPPPIANPTPAGANLAAALANAGSQPKPERIGMQTLVHAAVPAPITAAANSTPMAPVLPKAGPAQTIGGFASGGDLLETKKEIPSVVAKDLLKTEVDQPKIIIDDKADAALAAKIDAKLMESDPALDKSIADAAKEQAAASVVVDPLASSPSLAASANAAQAAKSIYPGQIEPAKPVVPVSQAPTVDIKSVAAVEPANSTLSTLVDTQRKPQPTPDPSAVVSLPAMKAGRESQEVLGGWGWGTDSHPAIKGYEGDVEDDGPPVESHRKTMLYVFGGLFAAAAIIVVIAMAMGGSKKEDKQVATTGSGSGSAANAIQYGSGVEYGSATGSPAGGSAIATGSDSGSASGSDSGSATASASGSAISGSGAGSGSVVAQAPAGSDSMTGSATAAPPPVAKPVETPPPPPPPPVEKHVTPPPPVVAQKTPPVEKHVAPPPPKHEEPKHTPPKHEEPKHVAEPKRTAEATPAARADAEAQYKQGIQLFARGDSAGALTSLRASLASNPGYPPTWRGLGLVFEKMGEKDQARAAFKRYLQLAPGAGDADTIRNRMERLGS